MFLQPFHEVSVTAVGKGLGNVKWSVFVSYFLLIKVVIKIGWFLERATLCVLLLITRSDRVWSLTGVSLAAEGWLFVFLCWSRSRVEYEYRVGSLYCKYNASFPVVAGILLNQLRGLFWLILYMICCGITRVSWQYTISSVVSGRRFFGG